MSKKFAISLSKLHNNVSRNSAVFICKELELGNLSFSSEDKKKHVNKTSISDDLAGPLNSVKLT